MRTGQLLGITGLGLAIACGAPGRTIDGYTVYERSYGQHTDYTIIRPDGFRCEIQHGTTTLAQLVDEEQSIGEIAYAKIPIHSPMHPLHPMNPINTTRRALQHQQPYHSRHTDKAPAVEEHIPTREERLAALTEEQRATIRRECESILEKYLRQEQK